MLNDFHPYAETSDFVLKKLDADPELGLSSEEILTRQKEYGRNEIKEEKKFETVKIILKQFKNPLALLLIASGAITLFLREYHNSIIIFGAVAVNSLIGFFEERRTSAAFSKLKSSIKKYATVVRNGRKAVIESAYLTPGDIIILKEGDMVPADSRIIQEKGLTINESVLTGEWFPREKTADKVDLKARLTDRINMVFTGTAVQGGWAKAVVSEIGNKTEFGKIANLVKTGLKRKTPLESQVAKISRFIGITVFFVVLILFFTGIARGISAVQMFLAVVAVAVAAVPEGLPIAITVILVLGMKNIMREGGLPRNMAALEVLGAANVILTDKTGTLTYADMKVSHIVLPSNILRKKLDAKQRAQKQEKENEAAKIFVLETAQFAVEAFIENPDDELKKWVIRGNPMERAIIEAGMAAGLNKEEIFIKNPRLDFLPFNSERRFFASIHGFSEKNKLFLNGAPEAILKLSSHYLDNGKLKRLLNPVREKLFNFYEQEAARGARMIAVASKEIDESDFPRRKRGEAERISKDSFVYGLTFYGFIGFHDPVREDAADYVLRARDAGIDIKIVTGDNLNTAKAVAEKIGLLSVGSVRADNDIFLTGEELENMDKNELQEKIDDVLIFSRTLPHQKMMIVEALQAKGCVVAMTGDGINDTPALNRADIGLSLGSGTDAAKEVSDIVLLNNSFRVIVEAIKQGRVIKDNIKKSLTYLLSTGFSEIILIGGSVAAGFPLPVLPAQILWANIIQEGFMNFAYGFEKGEKGVMNKENAGGKIFTRDVKIMIFVIGIITDIFLLILFFVLLKLDYDLGKIRTIMFAGLSSDAIFFALSLKSLKQPLWKINIFSNKYLIYAWLLSLFALVAALSFPPLQNLLELVPISANEFLIILGIGILNLLSIEAAKLWLNRNEQR